MKEEPQHGTVRYTNSGDLAADLTPSSVLYLNCPHCRSRSPLSPEAAEQDVKCPCCGKSSLLSDSSLSGVGPEREPDAPGPTLGRFTLLERLGSGGFGVVWKARDPQLDRIVALKVPHRERLGAAETEKFLREARAAAQLRHPNIVSVHEVGMEADHLYIISDFIEGLSLTAWLAENRPGYGPSAALCTKIAEGLHHAHQAGVIHRDLKPANIMIDRQGEPHIMDFGLAKRATGEATMTIDGHVLGTPAYMSPEQARGHAHAADPRSDVYALGVILFEVLTGERPFRGSLQMLLKQVIEEEPPSPRKFDSRVPRDLETICLKCLQKEPARRYPTALAVADELRRFVAGEPVLARPVGRLQRAARWCRRKPLVAGSLGAAVLGLLFGLAAASIGYVQVSAALRDTQAAQARAEESLRDARQAVDDLFTRVSEDRLLNQPGMQPLRADLLGRARDYYQKFLAESAGADGLRDELALAHFRVGLITEQIESPIQALAAYEQALAVQNQLAEVNPDDPQRLKAQGDTLNAIGRALQKEHRTGDALAAYGKAVGVRARLVSLLPENTEFRRLLASTYMNLGLAEAGRDVRQAGTHMEQAQAIRQEALSASPGEPKLRRDLAMGFFNLGALARATKDYRQGQQWIARARQLFLDLTESERLDQSLRYQVALCYRMQADLICEALPADTPSRHNPTAEHRERRNEALGLYQHAWQIMEPLAEKNPDVAEYQGALAEISMNIGQTEAEQGHLDQALAAFRRARAIVMQLIADHKQTARYRGSMITILRALGGLETNPSNREQILNTLQSLRRELEETTQRAPETPEVSQQLRLAAEAIEGLQAINSRERRP